MLFGAELRHAREAAGFSQSDLARLVHCDRSLIARIESGQRVPRRGCVDQCDEVLGTQGLLARIWSRVDWSAEVEHPDWFRRFVELEADAVELRKFQLQVVPGLLQTERYARALFTRGADTRDDRSVEERVAARLSRQHRFLDPRGPLLVVILDEGVIHRVVGSASVMAEQLAHLLAVAEQPNIALQVAPFGHHEVIGPDTSMTLVRLPDRSEWAYSECLDRGHFSNHPDALALHARTYDLVRANALSVRQSNALITSVMEGFDRNGRPEPQHDSLAKEQSQRRQRRRLHRGGPRIPRPRTGT